MTWEELKEKAKDIFKNRYNTWDEFVIGIEFENCKMFFRKSGAIDVEFPIGNQNIGGLDISERRTYDQMHQIMLALR